MFTTMTFQLILRDDLPFVNEVRNSAAPLLHDDRTFTLEETIKWYEATNPQWYIIRIHQRVVDNRVFKVRIGYFRTSWVDDRFYIGMDLHQSYQGKGLCQRAYKEFIPSLYNISNQTELWLEVLRINSRAIHIYEKLGFKCVDTINDGFLYKLEKDA